MAKYIDIGANLCLVNELVRDLHNDLTEIAQICYSNTKKFLKI